MLRGSGIGRAWIAASAVALVVSFSAGPASARTTEGSTESPCTVSGSARADVLEGTPGPDVICAGGGPDVVRSGAGNDTIVGGRGADDLRGGPGDDLLDGGRGYDRLSGGAGEDTCPGSPGRDRRNGPCPRPDPLFPPGYPPSGQPAPGRCWAEVAPPADWCTPNIHGFTLEPTVVDTSREDAELRWTIELSDDVSGVAWVNVFVPQPDGTGSIAQQVRGPIAGDAGRGTWAQTIRLPNGYQGGRHHLNVMVGDAAGNYFALGPEHLAYFGLPSFFEQIGAEDSMPPVLHHLEISPPTVDVGSADAQVTVRADVTDEFAGVELVFMHVREPGGGRFSMVPSNVAKLETGTDRDGVWRLQFRVPRGAERGTYEVVDLALEDGVHTEVYSSEELRAAGFQNTFEVTGS